MNGQQKQRTRRRWPILAAVGVATAVAAGAAFQAWGPATTTLPNPAPRGSALATASTQVLPQPARINSGIPVGYPHTTMGAISAAAHYTEARDILSPSLVASQIAVMAVTDPRPRALLTQRGASDATALRQNLGLDPYGASDQNDNITVQVRAYHLDQQTDDQIEVWLLTWRTTVTNGATQEHAAYTVPVALTWENGDWKLDSRTLPSAPAAADPDTAQAALDGWTPVA